MSPQRAGRGPGGLGGGVPLSSTVQKHLMSMGNSSPGAHGALPLTSPSAHPQKRRAVLDIAASPTPRREAQRARVFVGPPGPGDAHDGGERDSRARGHLRTQRDRLQRRPRGPGAGAQDAAAGDRRVRSSAPPRAPHRRSDRHRTTAGAGGRPEARGTHRAVAGAGSCCRSRHYRIGRRALPSPRCHSSVGRACRAPGPRRFPRGDPGGDPHHRRGCHGTSGRGKALTE